MKLPFSYTHKINKRSKSIRLKIEQGGKVIVVSPKFVPKFIINQFVKKHQDWIVNSLKKANNGTKFDSATHTFIFGKKYKREIAYSTTKKTGIYVAGEKLVFNPLTPPKMISAKDGANSKNQGTLIHKQKWDKKFQKKVDDFLNISS